MKKFTLTLLLVGAIAAPVALAHSHPRARAARIRAAFARLDLTADQKAQLRSIRETAIEKNRPLFEQFRAKREQLRSLRMANDPAAATVQNELREMREQMRTARQETRAKVMAVLTAEQRTRLEEMRKHRQDRRGRE